MKRVRHHPIGRSVVVASATLLAALAFVVSEAEPINLSSTTPSFNLARVDEHRAAGTTYSNGSALIDTNRRVLRLTFTALDWPASSEMRVTLLNQTLGGLSPTSYLGLAAFPDGPKGALTGGFWFQVTGTIMNNFLVQVDIDPAGAGGFRILLSTRPDSNSSWVTTERYYFAAKMPYTGDASIDTRKEYGEPNNENYVPDANAPPTPVMFGAWTFRGGLFAGYVPWTSNDYSGLSRIQLWQNAYSPTSAVTTNYPSYWGAGVSLYHTGIPTKVTAAGDPLKLGLYFPAANEATPNESTLTWDQRWNITAGTINDPSPLLVSSFTQGECANWNVLSGSAFERICIAVMNEANWVNGNRGWLYFASKEYNGLNLSAGVADIAPRAFPIHASEWEPYTGSLPW